MAGRARAEPVRQEVRRGERRRRLAVHVQRLLLDAAPRHARAHARRSRHRGALRGRQGHLRLFAVRVQEPEGPSGEGLCVLSHDAQPESVGRRLVHGRARRRALHLRRGDGALREPGRQSAAGQDAPIRVSDQARLVWSAHVGVERRDLRLDPRDSLSGRLAVLRARQPAGPRRRQARFHQRRRRQSDPRGHSHGHVAASGPRGVRRHSAPRHRRLRGRRPHRIVDVPGPVRQALVFSDEAGPPLRGRLDRRLLQKELRLRARRPHESPLLRHRVLPALRALPPGRQDLPQLRRRHPRRDPAHQRRHFGRSPPHLQLHGAQLQLRPRQGLRQNRPRDPPGPPARVQHPAASHQDPPPRLRSPLSSFGLCLHC
mmetsp:Transcript_25778/g.79298  ORF Transcript_25778/g.79298 Transcript_25778/m.79298 type:complete len:372 (+) Transcript_25778:2271-3386(+)